MSAPRLYPPTGPTKDMACVDCGMRIKAEIMQAKRHGWAVWVGGARCKRCCEALETAREREAQGLCSYCGQPSGSGPCQRAHP